VLIGALLDAGIDIPSQVSVIGSDNAAWGAWMRPALSSIAVEPDEIVSSITDALVAMVAGKQVPAVLRLDSTIRVIHGQTT
jgi:DNA-binding LacI/PurR family transcriptional regulator